MSFIFHYSYYIFIILTKCLLFPIIIVYKNCFYTYLVNTFFSSYNTMLQCKDKIVICEKNIVHNQYMLYNCLHFYDHVVILQKISSLKVF